MNEMWGCVGWLVMLVTLTLNFSLPANINTPACHPDASFVSIGCGGALDCVIDECLHNSLKIPRASG